MSGPPPSRPAGRRVIAGLVVVLGVVVLLVVWLGARPARQHAAAPIEPSAAEAPLAAARLPQWAAPPPPAPEDAPPDVPIIDEVTVEKQEVCEGEENLVTVKAHTPAGRDDAFLHYFIGTAPGRSVPVRAYLPAAGAEVPGSMQVQAFGRNNVVTTVPIPPYTVKRCKPERVLYVKSQQIPNTLDEFELTARVRELGSSPPLRVTAYRWSFGDGTKTVTERPAAVHRYAPSNPDALYSEFLVTCEAVGGDGRTVVGRHALSLKNTEAENLRFADTLLLSVELTPRFPQADATGKIVQSVRLYHHRPAPVRLEHARISYVAAGNKEAEPAQELSPVEVLGTLEVPPGRGVERTFRFDTKAHPGAVMVDYDLEGRTAEDVRAIGHFSLMRPPPPPTAENGEQVTDPLVMQKILRARERLGKTFVNDEDLLQLERDGAFADLKVPGPAPTETQQVEEATPPPAPVSVGVKAAIAARARAGR